MRQSQFVLLSFAEVSGEQAKVLFFDHKIRPDLDLAGFWQDISGEVEAGASSEQSARRELKEDTENSRLIY